MRTERALRYPWAVGWYDRVACKFERARMGLHASGENGVKAVIKNRFTAAARTYGSLGDMRNATKTPRSQVVLALDGNV